MRKPPSLARASWLRAPGLAKVFAAIAAAGGEARVAGGAVRNALMGLPVSEIDLATTLPPEQVTAACQARGLHVHPTGIAHGTVTVVAAAPWPRLTGRIEVTTGLALTVNADASVAPVVGSMIPPIVCSLMPAPSTWFAIPAARPPQSSARRAHPSAGSLRR